jgi:hypothetical protein
MRGLIISALIANDLKDGGRVAADLAKGALDPEEYTALVDYLCRAACGQENFLLPEDLIDLAIAEPYAGRSWAQPGPDRLQP